MTEPISLTKNFRNRFNKTKKAGLTNKNFIADSFDFTRTFSSFRKNNKQIFDEVKGFMRLIENPRFASRQSKDLKKELQYFNGNFRYLIRFPDKFPDYNALRNVFNVIQEKAGMTLMFVSAGKKETFEAVDNYLDTLEKKFVLVLDMVMNPRDLQKLIDKYINVCEEIVLLYRNWDDNKRNFDYVIKTATANKEKLHMAFVPVDLTSFGDGKLFATALICSDFKSVSLIDSEFPRYIFKHIKNRKTERTQKELIETSRGVNAELMCLDSKHRDNCTCFGNNLSVEETTNKCGVKETITFHNVEDLSKVYKEIKADDKVKKKVFELDSIKSLLNSLKSA